MASRLMLLLLLATVTSPSVEGAKLSARRRVKSKTQNSNSPTVVMDKMLINYHRSDLPASPVPVSLELDIQNVYRVLENQHEFSVQLLFIQTHEDQRLTFNESLQDITLSAHRLDELWQPAVMFENAKFPFSPDMNEETTAVKLNSSGWLQSTQYKDLTFKCPMDYKMFPFDVQQCEIVIKSLKYNANEVYFDDVEANIRDTSIDNFYLEFYHTDNCTDAEDPLSSPCSSVKFTLQRRSQYFTVQVFLPSVVIVMLSWTVFVVDIETGHQMIFSLMLILLMSALTWRHSPPLGGVSDLRAMDVWFIGCMLFLLLAVFEVVLFSYFNHRERSLDEILKNRKNNKSHGKGRDIVKKLSKCLLPVLFVCFNVIYLAFYMS